jgi:predicted enzyme related to lactoylglutathione lyase
MPATESHAPGTFCWTDLAAHDAAAAERFYTSLFGWTAEHTRFGPDEDDVYVMLLKDGKAVAALYGMDPAQRAQGVPPAWLSYVAVQDAARTAEKARGLGATVLADAFDVADFGRMALVADPAGGAVLALWQAAAHAGAALRDEPGAMCWNELGTRDPGTAAAFYAALFGWAPRPFDGGHLPYVMFEQDGVPVGGMFSISPEMDEMPTAWAPYFDVEDPDETARRVQELGGTILHPPFDLTVGRWAMLQDPQGAIFNVLRYEPRNS